MEDYDYLDFHNFLSENTRKTGAFPISKEVTYASSSIAAGVKTLVLFLNQAKKKFFKPDFLEEIRDVAKQFEVNVVYGSIDRTLYNEKVDYNDCDF